MRLQPVPLTDRGPACQAIVFITRPQISDFFFDKFLEYFFAEPDAAFFKSLGLNCVRIAVNYRHFEDDDNPRVLKTDGFRHLDRAIEACAKHQMYTIIDMHTGQNGGWHCDAGVHIAGFWIHKDFQDRLVWLWEEIARHYKDNPWVAGYNLMNEPEDSHSTGLVHFYDRVYEAIRTIDENHILFLDGNTYFIDFFPDDAKERWKNAAFTMQAECLNHPQNETECSLQCARKRAWMDQRGLCVWNGEWGPVYARREYDGEETDEINERRYNVLKDQLDIHALVHIGFQGMVYVSRDTPYMKIFDKLLERKFRLAVNAWGTKHRYVRYIYKPIIDLIKENMAEVNQSLYPPIWSLENRVTRLSRTMLVAEFMVKEWADTLKGLSFEQLDEIAASFKFDNCVKREGSCKVLTDHAALFKGTIGQ
ncbi:glycoside hydrolase family 5 protein [Paxillus involutus ATCC 200175]|nr:glycoside hydrolase family 5 protein [Paxillus involutus ATCC 200175]